MTNTNMLRELIQKKGLKYMYIATSLGISTYCLQQKIDNKTEFKASEVQELCNILGITDNLELKEEIFFCQESRLIIY